MSDTTTGVTYPLEKLVYERGGVSGGGGERGRFDRKTTDLEISSILSQIFTITEKPNLNFSVLATLCLHYESTHVTWCFRGIQFLFYGNVLETYSLLQRNDPVIHFLNSISS